MCCLAVLVQKTCYFWGGEGESQHKIQKFAVPGWFITGETGQKPANKKAKGKKTLHKQNLFTKCSFFAQL